MEKIWFIYKEDSLLGWAYSADDALRKVETLCRRSDFSDDEVNEIRNSRKRNSYNFKNSLFEVKMFENKIQYI